MKAHLREAAVAAAADVLEVFGFSPAKAAQVASAVIKNVNAALAEIADPPDVLPAAEVRRIRVTAQAVADSVSFEREPGSMSHDLLAVCDSHEALRGSTGG